MRSATFLMIIFLLAVFSLNFESNLLLTAPSIIVVPDDFPTIQEAINNAIEEDTVFVKTGIYYEHIVVNKKIALVGENVSTTIVDGNNTGHVINVISDNVSISGFTVQNSGNIHMPALDAGICLNHSSGCVVSSNRLIDNGFCGISLLYSQRNMIIGNNVTRSSWGGIHLLASSNNMVSKNIVDNTYGAINGHVSSNYNNFTENVISNSTHGMFYHASRHNNICGNNISHIAVEGIWLQDQVNYNVVAENNLVNNTVAIRLQGPNYYNALLRNVITDAEYGVRIEFADRNTVSGNIITDCQYGIQIQNSLYTDIYNNTIAQNYGSGWDAGIRLDYAGYTRLYSNLIVDNWRGILVYLGSPYVSIFNNIITGNEFGIRVANGGSSYLNVSSNIITNNRGYGIGLSGYGSASNYAALTRNLILNNSYGILLGRYSNYNSITQNTISQNGYGSYIEGGSTANTFYYNNFLNNTQHANISGSSINNWDNSYYFGGNYWSDHFCSDLYSGLFQNLTGSDGVGDSPYAIDSSNKDRYPLFSPLIFVPEHYSTIQEAINNASLGNRILVGAGVYRENVVINKFISLIGEGKYVTIIDANGTGNCITITRNSVNVASLTLQNSGRTLGDAGVYLDGASLCNISENYITDNFAGVWLEGSSGNFITANDIVANVDDGIVSNYSHNNTITRNLIALHEYFGLVLNESHNNTISRNNVTQTLGLTHGDGINLWRSESNCIYQNHVAANTRYGIRLEVQSNYNLVSGNYIRNCSTGVQIFDSSNHNNVCDNNVAYCEVGIDISNWAVNNTVFENNITSTNVGVMLRYAQSNRFYHNSFFGNTQQVSILPDGYANFWDDGYPSGGNYWSDHGGADIYCGLYQNKTGSDGIYDTPNTLNEDNVDNYPLIVPYSNATLVGDLNGDRRVDVEDIVIVINAFGASQIHPRWNPQTDFNSDGRIDIVDIVTVIKSYGTHL